MQGAEGDVMAEELGATVEGAVAVEDGGDGGALADDRRGHDGGWECGSDAIAVGNVQQGPLNLNGVIKCLINLCLSITESATRVTYCRAYRRQFMLYILFGSDQQNCNIIFHRPEPFKCGHRPYKYVWKRSGPRGDEKCPKMYDVSDQL